MFAAFRVLRSLPSLSLSLSLSLQVVIVCAAPLRLVFRNWLCSARVAVSLLILLFAIVDQSPHLPNCFTRVCSSPPHIRSLHFAGAEVPSLLGGLPSHLNFVRRVIGKLIEYSVAMEDSSQSGCTPQFERLNVSDACCTRSSGGKESDYCTAPGSGADHATTSYSSSLSVVEQRIEQSKSDWSMLSESRSIEVDGRLAAESNRKVFEDLQRHPKWGFFFVKPDAFPEFVVGEKFAEGGQAEICNVWVVWNNASINEYVREYEVEYVVKVFKKGTFLQDLQLQVPRGLLDFRAEILERGSNAGVIPRFHSDVVHGILLEDGRFAFLMAKQQFDLRFLIECNMESQSSEGKGPFSKEDAEMIMYQVALGLGRLHSLNIIHRDVKASNVLVNEREDKVLKLLCHIADFECSVGVQGSGFFRAPEILQACKNQVLGEKLGVFSKATDMYSYGMTCYEILIGKYPFEGHCVNEYGLVLGGQCPMIPEYVESWTRELLNRCWQSKPAN